ncbi:PEGA domain-containing protein [Candidatus Saccharibacteria bacterium]|nr:PEGA domain-containing protein [Candidatus Saccharibacteria bacterium]
MDYLDPRKRHAHNIRLIVGYFLVSIVIGLATYVLNQAANGYGLNVKTGQIIQNALLFTDSKPGGAEIYINNHDRGTTTKARLILPTGTYTLTLKKDGYRDWSRQFVLNEQSVARYVYPCLFPVKPVVTNIKSYTSLPTLVTQSPDRRWLLIQSNEASERAPTFDMYDTSTLDQASPTVSQISLPASVLTTYSSNSKLTEVEWSTDNNNLLLEHTYGNNTEFIVFNRDRPDQSFNVNRMFGVHPQQVNLLDKKVGQLYILRQPESTLQLGDTGNKTLGPVLIRHVLAFKPYGKNLVTYVTDSGEPKNEAIAKIWNNGDSFKLNDFPAGNKYLIDAAQFQGEFYYAAGSDTSERINIYKNPLDQIKNPAYSKALPILALHMDGGQKIGFSGNARFLGVEAGQQFSVYDFETRDSYQYTLSESITDLLQWMDGHRYIGQVGSKIFIMDYDGTNRQLIADSVEPFGGLFSRDYDHLMVINPSQDGNSYVLQDVDMRAGKDLPKK